jgi:hypothetical protein
MYKEVVLCFQKLPFDIQKFRENAEVSANENLAVLTEANSDLSKRNMEDERSIWIRFNIAKLIVGRKVVPVHIMEVYGGVVD